MRILIGYDGSPCADAALDDLLRAGLSAAAACTPAAGLRVLSGACRAMFVFDIGREVDLALCRRIAPELVREGAPLVGRPESICVESPPLRLEVVAPTDARDPSADSNVAVGVYDFGAIALTYAFPVTGTLGELRALSCRLTGDDRLVMAARSCASEVASKIAAAVADPVLARVSEEYLVFEVTEFESGASPSELATTCAQEIAAVLRAEPDTLSDQEVAHATATRISRTPDDLAILDWNAALVVHRRPEAVRAVLELANVQLLEMRFLDRTLDESLDRSYAIVSERNPWRSFLPQAMGRAMRRIAQRQVDAAILHERVTNALKLVGDQHLARVYRGAAARFELAEWNAANLQKLATLESIYQKVHDRAAVLRAELLEWFVIVLILASMVLPVFR